MSAILIREIVNTKSLNFVEIMASDHAGQRRTAQAQPPQRRGRFANKISAEKIDSYELSSETIEAIKECENGLSATQYNSYDDFLKELNA